MRTPDELPSKDFSEISSYVVCERKWYARHWLNLVPIEMSAAPAFGISMHKAWNEMYKSGWDLDAALAVWNAESFGPDSLRTQGLGETILRAYHSEYLTQPLKILHNEIQWFLPITRRGMTFTLHGRIDRIVEYQDRIWCMDHKTTTRLGATYFEQFNPNMQVAFYTKAGAEYFDDIAGMIIDAAFVGKQQRFQRDIIKVNPRELDMQFEEGLEWAVRVLRTEEALKACPEEWRTICPRAMISEACSSWAGCEYRSLCRWDFAQAIIDIEYKKEPWRP